jgi:hypothetical protein
MTWATTASLKKAGSLNSTVTPAGQQLALLSGQREEVGRKPNLFFWHMGLACHRVMLRGALNQYPNPLFPMALHG